LLSPSVWRLNFKVPTAYEASFTLSYVESLDDTACEPIAQSDANPLLSPSVWRLNFKVPTAYEALSVTLSDVASSNLSLWRIKEVGCNFLVNAPLFCPA